MSATQSFPNPTAGPSLWDQKLIFSTLADPVRCGLLFSIARGGPSTASRLRIGVKRKLDATAKQLAYLRDVGLLVSVPDPADGRRALYSIAPTVPLVKTETGVNMDFGFCLLRI